MTNHITDTFEIASTIGAMRVNGQPEFEIIGHMTNKEYAKYVKRAYRLAECARYNVPVASLTTANLDRIARMLGVM